MRYLCVRQAYRATLGAMFPRDGSLARMSQDSRKPLRRSPSPLAPAELTLIKKLLWDGMENKEVSALAGIRLGRPVHPSTVSRIKTGKIGGSVLWPDGSQGGMSDRPSPEDWSPDSLSLSEWPNEYQETILHQVNERRSRLGQEEIPPISPDYQAYLQSPIEEKEYFDQFVLQDLLRTEDRRRALLINEFRILQEEALEQNLENSLENCLSDTYEEREDTTPPPSKEWFKYDKEEWASVVQLIPDHPLVLRALRDKDGILSEAICIVLYNFRGDPKTLEIGNRVNAICSILKENEAQAAAIQKESPVATFMNDNDSQKGGE